VQHKGAVTFSIAAEQDVGMGLDHISAEERELRQQLKAFVRADLEAVAEYTKIRWARSFSSTSLFFFPPFFEKIK
jgi:hypothetical protein